MRVVEDDFHPGCRNYIFFLELLTPGEQPVIYGSKIKIQNIIQLKSHFVLFTFTRRNLGMHNKLTDTGNIVSK